MTTAIQSPNARTLTDRHARELVGNGCTPECHQCGADLRPGDTIDILHPWKSSGNRCASCRDQSPELPA